MNETEYHNPANLTPEQIGEGYELLKYGDEIQSGDEYWDRASMTWGKTGCAGTIIKKAHETIFCAHRRKKPGLTIEPGKHYRIRDGRRARIYATDRESPYTVHGAVRALDGWFDATWTCEGNSNAVGVKTPLDLIAPWVDLPEVDWSKLPETITCVTVDEGGEAFAWHCNPDNVKVATSRWHPQIGFTRDLGYRLFPGTVKFTGDWKQSKVKRPEVAK